MLLKEILNQVLREQDEASSVIEFPKEKFIVSVNKNKKELIFTPQESAALPNKIRPMVLMLKRNFNVSSVKNQEETPSAAPEEYKNQDVDIEDPNLRGVIIVTVDPREDMDKVVEFLSSQAGQ